ncbi:acid-sensing ion channel 4-B-like [Achroia grisella]|uniref:acid-sensing ion channel 4-B-like n=1 Tax=Achroia grisella TaxID=688607 RepID=UPI0027D2F19D|nr:acid-sensing ion channel 4-B-like [Achroia grisella]
MVKSLKGYGKDFCLYTSIHGFNHIAVPQRHWAERVFWICLTGAAIWGAIGVSLGQWQRYNENPTVVTLEKDFRTWMFNMPAITVCSKNRVDPKKLERTITKYWGVNQLDAKYEYYSKFVTTVANSDLFHLFEYETYKDDESLNVNLYQLAVDVMPEFLVKPSWVHGLDIKWTATMTESGVCYVTNSVAIADTAIVKPNTNDTKQFPLTCKYSSLRCYVLLEITNDTLMFTHSPYDVMDASVPPTLSIPSLDRNIELSVSETRCGKGVRELSPQRRGCLYTDEPVQTGRKVYSTNSCRLSCRSKLALKLCKCRPFYYFYEEGPDCSPSGMWCLATISHRLVNNDGIKCSCTAPCLDAVYKDIFTSDQFWTSGQFMDRGSVKYTIQPPRSRYTREIVFHFQDLIVSFGGAAGLFLGASFISFVEILYFIFEKVIMLFTKQNPTAKTEVKAVDKPTIIQYEMERILELNKILEDQREYETYGTSIQRLQGVDFTP